MIVKVIPKSHQFSSLNKKIRNERQTMSDEIFHAYDDIGCNLIRNYAPPGIGKTHLTVDIIRHHFNENYVIVIPNHKMATGKNDLQDMLDSKEILWLHIYGKTQKHSLHDRYCLRKKEEAYYPGCSFEFKTAEIPDLYGLYGDSYDYDIEENIARCSHRNECPYKCQFQNITDYRVIICVLEHVSMFNGRVLIIDESFEQKILKGFAVTPKQAALYNISITHGVEKKLGADTYTFYKTVETHQGIKIDNQFSYFLSGFFATTSDIRAYSTKNSDKFYLFGKRMDYLPNYTRMIFNCATTPLRLMYKLTNTENLEEYEPDLGGWYIYKSSNFSITDLKNPIIKFKHNWGKKFAVNWLSTAIKYLKPLGDDPLIVTKKAMEQTFIDEYKGSTFVHYNAGRGFNSADRPDGYIYLLLYGRWGFTPLDIEKWRLIGFNKNIVKEMEMSEMRQSLHRGRLLLHPNMPVITMSDRNLFPNIKPISVQALELFHKFYDVDMNLNNKELFKRLEIERGRKIDHFKKFVTFVRKHIYKID